VGVSFINKKAPVRRLFDPEVFHNGIYTVLSHKQKTPLPVKKMNFF
jgi:Ni,Fe-hydrogenase III component G